MDRALNELLFHTAFACMACDGDIAPEEVQLIQDLANKDKLFGNIDIYQELDSLCQEVNVKGKIFLKEYFSKTPRLTTLQNQKKLIYETLHHSKT